MNYPQTLEFLYSQLPMFQRVGAQAFKKDLGNTLRLCEALDNPHQKFRSVHVAGTNGKGSVSHSLAAIFQQAGYKTGLYTSPHLVDFRERIRINGQMIPEEAVVAFVDKIRPVGDSVKPSFFEMTVAMAFDYFVGQQVDIAIIETGMGGKYDSTNIIIPELSVITNIAMDHQQFLGDTLGEIAGEKAGIIKKEVPAIIGSTNDETATVFMAKAAEMNAPIYFADEVYQLEIEKSNLQYQYFSIKKNSQKVGLLKTDLTGNYQLENLPIVLVAVDILRNNGFDLKEEQVLLALSQVKISTGLRGRWEVLQEKPLSICDVAHNKAGLEKVLQQVSSFTFEQLHFVLGMVADKDVEAVLNILPQKARYYFCKPDLPRGLDVQILREKALAVGLQGAAHPSVKEAYNTALTKAGANDFILVTGSAFVVAEVLKELQ